MDGLTLIFFWGFGCLRGGQLEFTQFRFRVMPVGTCQPRCMHSVTWELDHKAGFGDIPAQALGVKMG